MQVQLSGIMNQVAEGRVLGSVAQTKYFIVRFCERDCEITKAGSPGAQPWTSGHRRCRRHRLYSNLMEYKRYGVQADRNPERTEPVPLEVDSNR